jgi:hypothetical protein
MLLMVLLPGAPGYFSAGCQKSTPRRVLIIVRNNEKNQPQAGNRTMSIKRHKDSHLDHALTGAQVDFVLGLSAAEGELTIQTVELPEGLGTVPCGLYGPIMGDAPVSDSDCVMAVRGERKGPSRLLKGAHPAAEIGTAGPQPRQVRTVTAISGPHDGESCVLFTAIGGPQAPREPFEFEADDTSDAAQESRKFWAEHALVG